MRLTLFAEAEVKGRRRVSWVLDRETSSIRPIESGVVFRVTRKAIALLLLLASRRLDGSSGTSLGWVELWEISNLKEWSGARTLESLAAQVRREIKGLHRHCPGVVETPRASQLKGPFRLSSPPAVDRHTRQALAELAAPLIGTLSPTSESLYSWLERTEPVWRSFHYFDKPGEALSSLPTIDDDISRDPLVRALACIAAARRLREIGEFGKANRALQVAVAAAQSEPYLLVRQHLEAMCSLQQAWLNYRKGDLDAAERSLGFAETIAANSALLRLRGQGLSLRSLVRRSRGLYAAALDDLWHAARLFVVEGDLFQLFAVYHNLACLIAAEAEEYSDERRRAMFRQALSYSQRNEAYCRRYGVGQNSVLNKLLQVGLHRELGNPDLALRVAGDAERLALDSQNFPDAMKAHRHRISLLLERHYLSDAKEMHEATVKALPDTELRRQCAKIYHEELERRSALRTPSESKNSDRAGRRARTPRL